MTNKKEMSHVVWDLRTANLLPSGCSVQSPTMTAPTKQPNYVPSLSPLWALVSVTAFFSGGYTLLVVLVGDLAATATATAATTTVLLLSLRSAIAKMASGLLVLAVAPYTLYQNQLVASSPSLRQTQNELRAAANSFTTINASLRKQVAQIEENNQR
jgi:hypothetical protein